MQSSRMHVQPCRLWPLQGKNTNTLAAAPWLHACTAKQLPPSCRAAACTARQRLVISTYPSKMSQHACMHAVPGAERWQLMVSHNPPMLGGCASARPDQSSSDLMYAQHGHAWQPCSDLPASLPAARQGWQPQQPASTPNASTHSMYTESACVQAHTTAPKVQRSCMCSAKHQARKHVRRQSPQTHNHKHWVLASVANRCNANTPH